MDLSVWLLQQLILRIQKYGNNNRITSTKFTKKKQTRKEFLAALDFFFGASALLSRTFITRWKFLHRKFF